MSLHLDMQHVAQQTGVVKVPHDTVLAPLTIHTHMVYLTMLVAKIPHNISSGTYSNSLRRRPLQNVRAWTKFGFTNRVGPVADHVQLRPAIEIAHSVIMKRDTGIVRQAVAERGEVRSRWLEDVRVPLRTTVMASEFERVVGSLVPANVQGLTCAPQTRLERLRPQTVFADSRTADFCVVGKADAALCRGDKCGPKETIFMGVVLVLRQTSTSESVHKKPDAPAIQAVALQPLSKGHEALPSIHGRNEKRTPPRRRTAVPKFEAPAIVQSRSVVVGLQSFRVVRVPCERKRIPVHRPAASMLRSAARIDRNVTTIDMDTDGASPLWVDSPERAAAFRVLPAANVCAVALQLRKERFGAAAQLGTTRV